MTDEEIEKFAENAWELQRSTYSSALPVLRPWSELGLRTKQRLIDMAKAYLASVAKINDEEPE